ncbi:hypothetical protein JYU34_013242 [Plutella xylostella]|uniref:Uncharacterized protein n=1 Tax=Plutella xylostella TaxID=51655 RepID=A0ABQ7Q9D9_PLUXY|nr:hypothetical protein JYU34_013242 [Plutella xylostella]
MGNTIKPQKEEVIINQNGIGSTNSASTEQLQFHVSAISIVMMMILCLLLLLAAYLAYKCYKKCHHDWINDQILRQNLRRSLFRSRALRASPRADEPRCAGCGARTRPAEELDVESGNP